MMDDFKGNAAMAARNTAETEADVQLLVECLRCQLDSPSSLKQALCTLATILSSCSEAKDYFRECGGVKFVVSLLTSDMPRSVKQAAMFSLGCAVERNTLNQKQLCQSSLFSLLYEYLTDKLSPSSYKQSANFFLLCLVSNNGTGQQLARKSNCIQALMQLFRNCSLQTASSDLEPEGDLLDRVEPKQDTGLMNSISSALSACVNNPQNDVNQRLCALVFPHALRILQNYTSPALLRPVLSFIGLAAANNVHNQQRLNKCGGLEVLVNALHQAMNNQDNTKEKHQLAVCITSTIDAVIADDAVNVARVGDLGLVPLLLRLVQCPDYDLHEQLQVMVTLAHCTDSSAVNQEAVLENDGMRILIKQLAHNTDEEVSRAIKYVLHTCSSSSKAIREKETNKSHENRDARTTSEKSLHQDDITRKLDELSAKLEQTTTLQQIQNLLQSAIPAAGKSSGAPATTPAKCDDPTLLKKQLEQEKSLREQFQHQVTALRKTEEERKKKEAATTRRTQELMKELEKQQQQQQNTESQAYNEKERLLEIKRQKEKEMADIDKKLKRISEIVGDDTCTKQSTTKKNQLSKGKENTETCSPEKDCSVCSYNSEGQKLLFDNPRYRNRNIQSAAVSQSRSSPLLRPKTFTAKEPSSVKSGHGVLKEHHSKKHDGDPPEKECCRVIQGSDSVASSGKNFPARKSWPGVFVKPSAPVRKRIGSSALRRRGHGIHDQSTAQGSAHSTEAYNYARRITPDFKRSKHQRSVSDSSVPAFDLNKYNSSAGSVPSSPALSVFDMKLCRVSLSRLDQPCGVMSDNRSSIRTAAGPQQEVGEEMLEMMENSPPGDESLSPQDHPEETPGYVKDQRIVPSHMNSSGRSNRSRTGRRRLEELCPGCQPPNALQKHILNSRTVNIALETNNFTCPAHRAIRELERERIARMRQSMKSQTSHPTYLQKIGSSSVSDQKDQSVYDFPSSSTTDSSDPNDPKKVSPPVPASVAPRRIRSVSSYTHSTTGRRRRVPFTPQEETNITHGVQHLGKFWTQILNTYDFHSTRTAVDLKDKFKRMSAKSRSHSDLAASKGAGKPFSMCEERRLARGVRVHGHNWQFILHQYKFAQGRTAEELRNRWRAINTRSARKTHT